ncbi:hypothetical protein BaRGS_00024287, partial [Batillaria attramentaria]
DNTSFTTDVNTSSTRGSYQETTTLLQRQEANKRHQHFRDNKRLTRDINTSATRRGYQETTTLLQGQQDANKKHQHFSDKKRDSKRLKRDINASTGTKEDRGETTTAVGVSCSSTVVSDQGVIETNETPTLDSRFVVVYRVQGGKSFASVISCCTVTCCGDTCCHN